MTRAKRSAALLLMAIAAAALPAAAQLALNPIVTVLAQPRGPVPADCATGETTAAPRVVIGEPAPEAPAAVPAPPSNELRAALWRLRTAAAGDDYVELKAALTAARAAASTFPPGGERDAANEALAVYADVERLWDYAHNSPTGAFFDASADNGALLSMLNRYPAVGHALADSTMEIGGRTVYPTREARQFLAAEGSKKLAWMGTAPPTREAAVTEEPPLTITHTPVPAIARVPEAAPTPAPRPRIPRLKPQPTAATTTSPTPAPVPVPAPKGRPGLSPAAGLKPGLPKAPAKKAVPAPAPAPTPVPLPMPAPIVAEPKPAPVETTTTAAPQPAPAPVTNTVSTAPAPMPTSTTPAEKPEAVGGRINLLLALILIVVGLGVLIFLFRASD